MFKERSKCKLKTHKTLNFPLSQLIRKLDFTSDVMERENKGYSVGGRYGNEGSRGNGANFRA